jgi:hypothetical protein
MLILFSVGSEVASHQSSNICSGQVATFVNIHNIDVGINCKTECCNNVYVRVPDCALNAAMTSVLSILLMLYT